MARFDSIALTIAAVGVGTSAFAADVGGMSGKARYFTPNDILRANNQLSADFIATHIDYSEFNDPSRSNGPDVLDSEKGWLPGGQVSYSFMNDWFGIHNLYTSGSFSWVTGQTTYDGVGVTNTLSLVQLRQTNNADVKDADFRLGKGFDLAPNSILTPYVGAGTHWWTRTILGASGYKEQYSHTYAGGGLMLQYAPVHDWVLTVYGLAGATFNAHLDGSPTPGGSADIQSFGLDLGSSAIYMTGASVDYAFTRQWHANAGVDYVNFRYGESGFTSAGTTPLLSSVYEPTSRTSNVTMKIGLGYSFYQ